MYQAAFRKIRLVAGLTYEHEIIDRFEHQHAYLQEMDDKIVFLRNQVAKIKQLQEQMKVCLVPLSRSACVCVRACVCCRWYVVRFLRVASVRNAFYRPSMSPP